MHTLDQLYSNTLEGFNSKEKNILKNIKIKLQIIKKKQKKKKQMKKKQKNIKIKQKNVN